MPRAGIWFPHSCKAVSRAVARIATSGPPSVRPATALPPLRGSRASTSFRHTARACSRCVYIKRLRGAAHPGQPWRDPDHECRMRGALRPDHALTLLADTLKDVATRDRVPTFFEVSPRPFRIRPPSVRPATIVTSRSGAPATKLEAAPEHDGSGAPNGARILDVARLHAPAATAPNWSANPRLRERPRGRTGVSFCS